MTINELKYYSSLLQKKIRKQEEKFLVEGFKLIFEALNSSFECEKIFYTNSFNENNSEKINLLKSHTKNLECIKTKELERLIDVKTPQEIVGVFKYKKSDANIFQSKIIAALEHISDPGNFGTIIRNCDWFGIEEIIISDDCAEIFSPKVIRSSAGSVFHVKINEEKNFITTLMEYKNKSYKLLCADLKGNDIKNISIDEKIIVAFANEANGPTDELKNISDELITIPKKGKAESLNVANASAVILYELTN